MDGFVLNFLLSYEGKGGGSFGRRVTVNPSGPQFESRHLHRIHRSFVSAVEVLVFVLHVTICNVRELEIAGFEISI